MSDPDDFAIVPERELEAHAASLTERLPRMLVRTTDEFEAAGAVLVEVARYLKRVDALTGPTIDAAKASLAAAQALRARLRDPAVTLKEALGRRMADYEQALREAQRRADEDAKRERDRLLAEEHARHVAAQAALRAEADARTLAAAERAEAAGNAELAEKIIDQRTIITPPEPRAVFVPRPPETPLPRASGVSFRDNWTAVVENLGELIQAVATGAQPEHVLQPNQSVLNSMARALREGLKIPGVVARNQRVPSTRT